MAKSEDSSTKRPGSVWWATGETPLGWPPAVIVIVIMTGVVPIFVLTLILAFHFQSATDTTAILGAIIPIFTAVVGILVGTKAGQAAGTAAKKSSDNYLLTANDLTQTLSQQIAATHGAIKTKLSKRSGSSDLSLRVQDVEYPIVQDSEFEGISTTVAKLQGVLAAATK